MSTYNGNPSDIMSLSACVASPRLDVIVLVITPPSHSATVVSSFTGGVSNGRAPLGLWVYIHGDVSRLVVSF